MSTHLSFKLRFGRSVDARTLKIATDFITKGELLKTLRGVPTMRYVRLLGRSAHETVLDTSVFGQGSTGPAGVTGPTGPTAYGLPGLTGLPGPRGADGPDGARGQTGPRGDTGIAGPTGEQGNTGQPGLVGQQGGDGDTGPTGSEGEKGAPHTGPIGLTGSDGPQGPTGPQGDTGPEGGKGALGIVGGVGEVGATGPTGAAGPAGPVGVTGDVLGLSALSDVSELNDPHDNHAILWDDSWKNRFANASDIVDLQTEIDSKKPIPGINLRVHAGIRVKTDGTVQVSGPGAIGGSVARHYEHGNIPGWKSCELVDSDPQNAPDTFTISDVSTVEGVSYVNKSDPAKNSHTMQLDMQSWLTGGMTVVQFMSGWDGSPATSSMYLYNKYNDFTWHHKVISHKSTSSGGVGEGKSYYKTWDTDAIAFYSLTANRDPRLKPMHFRTFPPPPETGAWTIAGDGSKTIFDKIEDADLIFATSYTRSSIQYFMRPVVPNANFIWYTPPLDVELGNPHAGGADAKIAFGGIFGTTNIFDALLWPRPTPASGDDTKISIYSKAEDNNVGPVMVFDSPFSLHDAYTLLLKTPSSIVNTYFGL